MSPYLDMNSVHTSFHTLSNHLCINMYPCTLSVVLKWLSSQQRTRASTARPSGHNTALPHTHASYVHVQCLMYG